MFYILVGEESNFKFQTIKQTIRGCPLKIDISMNDVSLDDPKLKLDPDVVLFNKDIKPFAFINSLSIPNGISVEMTEESSYTDWFDEARYA